QTQLKEMKAAADRLEALMTQRIADVKSKPVDSEDSWELDDTYTTEYYKLQRERDEIAAKAQQSTAASQPSGGRQTGVPSSSGGQSRYSSAASTPSVTASSFEVKVAPGRVGAATPPVSSSSSSTPATPRSPNSGPSIAPGTVGGGLSATAPADTSTGSASRSSYQPTTTTSYPTSSSYVATSPGDVTQSTTSDKIKHGGEVTWDYTKKGGRKVGGWMKDGYGAAKRKWG
ncbi:LPXTG-motif cell wall anchor domain protein, partial [Perkinsus olseni]